MNNASSLGYIGDLNVSSARHSREVNITTLTLVL